VGGYAGLEKSSWVAQRVPKGHATVVANNFNIREVPDEPNEDFLFSPKLREVAQAANLWHPGQPFDFTKIYSTDPVTFLDIARKAPIPLYGSLRVWRSYNLLAPSYAWPLYMSVLEYPFSIPVDKKITVEQLQDLHGDLYRGTEFDLSKGELAGPFGNPFPVEGGVAGSDLGQLPRGISIARTVYAVVNQGRPKGSVAWFAADTPATSVYVPILAESDEVDKAYQTGTNKEFTRASAWWAFDFTSNYMKTNFNMMYDNDVHPLKTSLQKEIHTELMEHLGKEPQEKKKHHWNKWQKNVQKKVVKQWWELSDKLIVKYNDGFLNEPEGAMGAMYGYPLKYAQEIGFNHDVHPIHVMRIPSPFQENFPLAQIWNTPASSWMFTSPGGPLNLAAFIPSPGSLPIHPVLLALVIGGVVGFLVGKSSKSARVAPMEEPLL